PAVQLARAPGTLRLGREVLSLGGNLRLRFVFRNIERLDELAYLTGIAHLTDPASARIAVCCSGSMVINDQTSFGTELASLQLRPRGVVAGKGLRAALDIDL
ncbi:MAG: hypothetical protein ACRDKS_10235, partial [Actinomycetota bacterium]